jgi:hypothetical protein
MAELDGLGRGGGDRDSGAALRPDIGLLPKRFARWRAGAGVEDMAAHPGILADPLGPAAGGPMPVAAAREAATYKSRRACPARSEERLR